MVVTDEIKEKLEQFPNKYGGGPLGLGKINKIKFNIYGKF